jgi:hypothetical protein
MRLFAKRERTPKEAASIAVVLTPSEVSCIRLAAREFPETLAVRGTRYPDEFRNLVEGGISKVPEECEQDVTIEFTGGEVASLIAGPIRAFFEKREQSLVTDESAVTEFDVWVASNLKAILNKLETAVEPRH